MLPSAESLPLAGVQLLCGQNRGSNGRAEWVALVMVFIGTNLALLGSLFGQLV